LPESLLDRRLKLGRFLGIDLFVHWTFALVIVYVAFMTRQGGTIGIAFAIAQLLGVFLCVTLHEYGHAMAARQFGISTADITLLPIGGVARLKQMPRIPWQELVVAVAGPAVNVGIAIGLMLAFVVLADPVELAAWVRYFVASLFGFGLDQQTVEIVDRAFSAPSWLGYGIAMLIINVMLVLFNLIPAFPMDGGRVFRSLLAMAIDYRRATQIAARVGLFCAVGLALLALNADPPQWLPVMIAAFVGYAGMAEARQVEVLESVRGLTARDVMVRSTESIPMDSPLGQIAGRWQQSPATVLPVVSIVGSVVGLLHLQEVQRAIDARLDLRTTAGQLLDHSRTVEPIQDNEPLESAMLRRAHHSRQIPVVNDQGQLCGIVDLDTMILRGRLSKVINVDDIPLAERFDQST
jgi:Zn-dependent protease